ncbi:hypothetical protein AYO41_03590 [Verrucomicrobia bacterium SCGC AG-212-E04]|nr:hypothetical protein AYO41_03590 [Verrucomicrobia bacterium SCGC AG-212-E04]
MTNRIRKSLFGAIAAVAVAGALTVYAQGPGGHHGPWGAKHDPSEMLSKRLGLTDAQKAQVQPILDSSKAQLKAIHDEARTKAQAVMADTTAKITPFLTPEQQEDLRAMKRQHDRMQAERAQGGK